VKVVSLVPFWREELAARLAAGVEFVAVDPADAARMASELADAHVVLTAQLDAPAARACRSLELIVSPAAGTEGIDRSALPPGVAIVNGRGHEQPISEYVIGALVALRQHFADADKALRAGEWRYGFLSKRGFVDELFGSTLGVVGFGRIGTEVARRADAFGIKCRALTFHPNRERDTTHLALGLGDLADPGQVDALVRTSDALVLACELSPATRALLDARRFALMPSHGLLVNVARGAIADEKALFEALQGKRIAGAALDVWYQYPERGSPATHAPSDLPFAQLDNVLMTPHCSGWTKGQLARKLDFLAREINDWYESRRPAR